MSQLSKNGEVTRTVPVVAIRGVVVFPNTEIPLMFQRPQTVAAVKAAFQGDRLIGIFTQRDSRIANPTQEDLYGVGTLGIIQQMMSTDGELHVLVKGVSRIRLSEIVFNEPYLVGRVVETPEEDLESDKVKALAKHTSELFKKAINFGKNADIMTVMKLVSGKVEPVELVDQLASILEIKLPLKQELLEIVSVSERFGKVKEYLSQEVNVLELEKSILTKTQKRFEDQMRKAMLREKKKTIEEELGQIGEEEPDALERGELKDLKTKIKQAEMPEETRKKAEKELQRLRQLSPHNPEGAYIRNYLDWLTEMPWSKASPNDVSIGNANNVLDEDHYGIKKVKERILEFLAVMKLKSEFDKRKTRAQGKKSSKDGKIEAASPTILCFIGPPGVGKTSIGKSIARALGRKFVRVSLGGIRDEAEIRGHRRTYVGAMPGRIIQGVKNVGTKNPVFMLDEIDKIGIDFRGDPSAALLEALDPEQNKEFSDHYLEVPFDLSQVIFICTGNVLDSIPPALRDRMEVIRFVSYTEDEKFHIARNFLWKKQLEIHGLKDINMTSTALYEVIKGYTREAGVRGLERSLATILRKIARRNAEGKKTIRTITSSHVRRFLGPRQFTSLIAEREDEVGVATGLAYTSVGGDILFIEVALMPGKGKLTLTGQLGEVMQESAKAAFTWARAHWEELGLKSDFASRLDVHIHVPEGAVPKDGPSAGIALATALASALTKRQVSRKVGMTGEITLRGRVLEIGGIKEKVIAGHRAGLKTIILPKENQKDLEDVPSKVKRDIKFVFVETLDQVFKVALKDKKRKETSRPHTPTYIAAN